jgi:uncharacterized membrane protein
VTTLDRNLLEEIWQSHGGKILGCSVGFIIGILVLMLGFFQTLFVLFCVIAGFMVGKRIDEKEDLMDILDKLLPPGYHR